MQTLDLGEEIKPFENIARRRREPLDIGIEVGANIVLIAEQFDEIERRRVVKSLFGFALEERLGINALSGLGRLLLQNRVFRHLQDAIQAAQDGKGQDDLAIFGSPVIPAQQIGDRPDEGRLGLVVHNLGQSFGYGAGMSIQFFV